MLSTVILSRLTNLDVVHLASTSPVAMKEQKPGTYHLYFPVNVQPGPDRHPHQNS